jgi:hypothetical protein
MGWTTYVDALRLDRRTWYYIWRVDDDLSVDPPLLRAPSGALLHASEAGALEIARQIAEPITPKELHTADLDTALAWTAAPHASSLDAGLLMTSWHMLVDLGALPDPADEHTHTRSQLGAIFDKVHWPGPTPVEWSDVELGLLAATLQEGIERLRGRMAAIVAPQSAPPAG